MFSVHFTVRLFFRLGLTGYYKDCREYVEDYLQYLHAIFANNCAKQAYLDC